MFEDDGLFTPCHSNMEGTEGVKVCIQCCLCMKKSYSSSTISLHLKTIHYDQTNDWFEPTPALEGDVQEVTNEILAANLQEIEAVKEKWEEDG